MTLVPWYLDRLACPDCRGELSLDGLRATCACGFSRPAGAPLDLRPVAPAPRTLSVAVSTTAPADLATCRVERPERTYDGPAACRDSSELFSAVSAALKPGATLLDLGCGPRDQAAPAEHYGVAYVGVDYASTNADILADAHAIPFGAASFDLVLSYAVLEHLYNPFLAVAEVVRVLKPGGIFFGTVSQGEPFHASFFHHTSWGLLHLLHQNGLEITQLWSSYDTLRALAKMGRYPRAGRPLLRLLDRFLGLTLLAPRRSRWSRREREIDALHRAASLCFVAIKADSERSR